MKPGAHAVVASAARLFTPLIVLFAGALLAGGAAGGGLGFAAGLAFALALMLHALAFGAAASRAALPPALARALLAIGVATTLTCAGLRGLSQAPHLIEAGVFVATAASAAIAIQVLFARAPTLRDEDL
jgi:multisubunit Na+/H+ antiporter MnhB subunit